MKHYQEQQSIDEQPNKNRKKYFILRTTIFYLNSSFKVKEKNEKIEKLKYKRKDFVGLTQYLPDCATLLWQPVCSQVFQEITLHV